MHIYSELCFIVCVCMIKGNYYNLQNNNNCYIITYIITYIIVIINNMI